MTSKEIVMTVDERPKVTIITPSYNQGHYIEATIESVLLQTYKNIEYFLIDGGSTDITHAIIDKYREQIDWVVEESDDGQSAAINKGFLKANGVLVGWINSDDILYPESVERIVEQYTRQPTCTIFYNSKLDILSAGGTLVDRITTAVISRDNLIHRDYSVPQPGSFYLNTAVRKSGGLNPKLQYCMDLDLWLKLLNCGGLAECEGEPLAAFRMYPGTKTSTGGTAFLNEIIATIQANGAGLLDPSMYKARKYWMKFVIRELLTKFGIWAT